MSPQVRSALVAILARLFSWVAHRPWRRLSFRCALPLRGVVTAHEPEGLEIPLRGRAAELVRLGSALQGSNLIVIGGRTGIGKTTLGRVLAGRLEWTQVGIWVDSRAGMGLESLDQCLGQLS